METTKILSADLLDLLFEGRNKSYGAYDLRKTYDRRIKYSLAGTFFLCLILVVGSILANGKSKSTQQELSTVVSLEAYAEPPKEIPKPPLPKIKPPKVEMTIFTPPKIVEDDKIKPQDEIKDVDQLAETKIGPITQEGIKGDDVIAPPVESKGINVEAPKKDDIDIIFITVQKQAQFPGGIGEWTKFLERYLNRDLPSENGAPLPIIRWLFPLSLTGTGTSAM